MTSMPKREMSNRLAPVAINSMAQQARPIGIGQREFFRNQLIAASSFVWMTSPSILESYPNSAFFCIRLAFATEQNKLISGALPSKLKLGQGKSHLGVASSPRLHGIRRTAPT